ncbi:hypothetical protein EJ02DRAFT_341923 [Clathrospora elynae]|uniref:Spindle pole body associated protein SnaD n=1 Tax=Clathrospora elynae TaxID=706981 RepID=A0A6A5STL5_9PLEO|nr:hypothetical protein EJ02DRAFT_341923 [Clathrospora elynae]
MARTHSSHTASPTRFRSPQRSPARRPSEDGSQYEMDLDALGLNSTFESTELDGSHEPPVDRVETSEIEGPEDFTMNMTYWMTADLPLAQIKSRKEASARRSEVRMDAMQEGSEERKATEAGDQAAMEENTTERRSDPSRTATPTMRANGTTAQREYSTPASERSMENEEKVRSFLSALPDTDMEGALTGTPLHVPRHSFLQVPRSSPPKARSLQPTVEDYDTPRKPTQETVIRHNSAIIDTSEQDSARNKIAELHSRLEQQEMASRSRITELGTILSYTRSELEGARKDNYRLEERLGRMEESMERQNKEFDASRAGTEAGLKARANALETRMHEFGEEVHLQNLAKLQNQREDHQGHIRTLEESKRLAHDERRSLEQELAQARQSHQRELQDLKDTQSQQPLSTDEIVEKERLEHFAQLLAVQARANALQKSLETAAAEVKAAREEAQKNAATRTAIEAKARGHTNRITELESHLQTARFELECAQADAAAKNQLFQTNLDLNSRLRTLRSELVGVKEAKHKVEMNFTEVERQYFQLLEGRDAIIEDVRDKAEDAVRKAGAMLEQERSEKRRANKDLRRTMDEVAKLREEAAQRLLHEEEVSHDESSVSSSQAETRIKDTEISNLSEIIRKQVAEMKTLKSETTGLKKENKKLRCTSETSAKTCTDYQTTVASLKVQMTTLRTEKTSLGERLHLLEMELETQVTTLRTENMSLRERLQDQEQDFEAINKAMDEKLAAMVSKVMKERAKTVVGKRDGQWVEKVGRVQTDKELMGKVLMRQWGREEVGVADETGGSKQGYKYKYVQRS